VLASTQQVKRSTGEALTRTVGANILLDVVAVEHMQIPLLVRVSKRSGQDVKSAGDRTHIMFCMPSSVKRFSVTHYEDWACGAVIY
jgi:hypothetical protein